MTTGDAPAQSSTHLPHQLKHLSTFDQSSSTLLLLSSTADETLQRIPSQAKSDRILVLAALFVRLVYIFVVVGVVEGLGERVKEGEVLDARVKMETKSLECECRRRAEKRLQLRDEELVLLQGERMKARQYIRPQVRE